tara:strand:+ start:1214 stop:1699 length:486 start_codon:yes stop_codon:yes gene_type:complete
MCFALAGLDRITARYARLKYANETSHYTELSKYVCKEIVKIAKEQGWKHRPRWSRPNDLPVGVDGFFAFRLAELALQENVGSDRCSRCNGRGTIHTGYISMDCFSCEGTGILRRTEAYRAKFMGMQKSMWDRLWKYRFRRHVLGIFDVFEFEISKELDRRL